MSDEGVCRTAPATPGLLKTEVQKKRKYKQQQKRNRIKNNKKSKIIHGTKFHLPRHAIGQVI